MTKQAAALPLLNAHSIAEELHGRIRDFYVLGEVKGRLARVIRTGILTPSSLVFEGGKDFFSRVKVINCQI